MGRMLDRINPKFVPVALASVTSRMRDHNGAQEGDVDPEYDAELANGDGQDTSIDEQVANNQPHREGDE